MEKFLVIVMIVAVGVISGVLLLSKTLSPTSSLPDLNLNYNVSPTGSQNQQSGQGQTPSNSAQNYLYPQSEWVTNASSAAIHTTKGDITIQLYTKDAPQTVTNFATLATKGYYNNLTFHRVEAGFVIQGGDPNGNGTGGRSIYGETFADELNQNTPSYQAGYKQGVVAMANRGPNTNGSQFFIMLADNDGLPKNYTIFGKVTSGMEVVQQIQVGDKMTSISVE